MPDLLIELASEEIPARMQKRASDDLKRLLGEKLSEAGLSYGAIGGFVTLRRLTVIIEGLPDGIAPTSEERRGPRADAHQNAIEGFARGAGIALDSLELRSTPKGDFYYAIIEKKGQSCAEIIREALQEIILSFPWPKSMRWGAGQLRWVRPLHAIAAILWDEAGHQIIDFEIEGIKATDRVQGHPYMAPAPVQISNLESYQRELSQAYVVLDPAERAARIEHEARQLAFASGLELIEDKQLIEELAGMTEWPVALIGKIDDQFQVLPPEVLQVSMRVHQRFLSLINRGSGRIEGFIAVADKETKDQGETILAGNKKVLAARLTDALFFWENDLRYIKKEGLRARGAALSSMVFHRKLGSQAQRVSRIEEIGTKIAPMLGAEQGQVREAAQISKADLTSEMVYEFPELQGVMGKYYAEVAGHSAEISEVCEQHYAPLGPSDAVPSSTISQAVSLADKLDMLAGFWAINEKPTSSKDPFALRRAALGVIRILIEGQHNLSFAALIQAAFEAHETDEKTILSLKEFIIERLKIWLKAQNIRPDAISACLANEAAADDLFLLSMRARVLSAFLATENGYNLLQSYRRAANIVSQAEAADGVSYSFGADVNYADGVAEKALFAALDEFKASQAASNENVASEMFYRSELERFSKLREPLDAFFDQVQINTESSILRRNRLNLLSQLRDLASGIADLSLIEG